MTLKFGMQQLVLEYYHDHTYHDLKLTSIFIIARSNIEKARTKSCQRIFEDFGLKNYVYRNFDEFMTICDYNGQGHSLTPDPGIS